MTLINWTIILLQINYDQILSIFYFFKIIFLFKILPLMQIHTFMQTKLQLPILHANMEVFKKQKDAAAHVTSYQQNKFKKLKASSSNH